MPFISTIVLFPLHPSLWSACTFLNPSVPRKIPLRLPRVEILEVKKLLSQDLIFILNTIVDTLFIEYMEAEFDHCVY